MPVRTALSDGASRLRKLRAEMACTTPRSGTKPGTAGRKRVSGSAHGSIGRIVAASLHLPHAVDGEVPVVSAHSQKSSSDLDREFEMILSNGQSEISRQKGGEARQPSSAASGMGSFVETVLNEQLSKELPAAGPPDLQQAINNLNRACRERSAVGRRTTSRFEFDNIQDSIAMKEDSERLRGLDNSIDRIYQRIDTVRRSTAVPALESQSTAGSP
mmetsp:Transcript_80221/g.259793  ORF Transcript_80221/g.259793 Transcript_80221/m.259793 type:complete len:216 (+) Transcript_80221:485-1132(+)